MTGDIDEGPVTLGELGRLLKALTDQVGLLSQEIKQQGEANRERFDALDERFVRKDIYTLALNELRQQKADYQRQTDVAILGVEEELRKQQKDVEQADKDRKVELDRIASQRHNDRVIYAVAILTAFVLPLAVALATGTWHP